MSREGKVSWIDEDIYWTDSAPIVESPDVIRLRTEAKYLRRTANEVDRLVELYPKFICVVTVVENEKKK